MQMLRRNVSHFQLQYQCVQKHMKATQNAEQLVHSHVINQLFRNVQRIVFLVASVTLAMFVIKMKIVLL